MTAPERARFVTDSVQKAYPGWTGCADERFVADETRYKRKASEKALQLLARDRLAGFLAASDHEAFLTAFRQAAQGNNLLFQSTPATGDLSVL